jgi:hypothetical protein
MDMIVKIKKLLRMSVLFLIAISVILLTGCGKAGTPPPGAALTIATYAENHSAPGSTTDIKTETYRVTVADSDGTPLEGVDVDIQALFTTGDNINFNGSGGTFTSVTTGNFGFTTFFISAPTYSIGPLATPSLESLTPSASGGNLNAGTFKYGVTATDAATPAGETTISNILTTTTSTTGSSVTITWKAVPRASGYNVYGDEGTPTLGKLTVSPLDASKVCDALTLVCSFTDQGGGVGAAPPSSNSSGLGLNPVKGTLTATAGALLTTLDISQ